MKYYKSNSQKPLSATNNKISKFSKVQSKLAPSVRSILSNSSLQLGTIHETLPPDSIPLHYSKTTFLENFQRFKELQSWYEDNREVCERVSRGDYSDFDNPKPVEPEPEPEPEPAPTA